MRVVHSSLRNGDRLRLVRAIPSSVARMSATILSGCAQLPSCTSPAFDVTVSSGQIDAEVRRAAKAGEAL